MEGMRKAQKNKNLKLFAENLSEELAKRVIRACLGEEEKIRKLMRRDVEELEKNLERIFMLKICKKLGIVDVDNVDNA